MPAAGDDDGAVHQHGVDIDRAGREEHLGRVGTGGPRGVQPDGDEVGPGADREPPGVRPADRVVPGELAEELLGAEPATLLLVGAGLAAALRRARKV